MKTQSIFKAHSLFSRQIFLSSILFSALIAQADTQPATTSSPQAEHGQTKPSGVSSVPAGESPVQAASQNIQDSLLAAMCASATDKAQHFDCAVVKEAVDQFQVDSGVALKTAVSPKIVSNLIQNLLLSKHGTKENVSGNACSEKDGGQDIWARDADAVLQQLIESKNTNSQIKDVAKIEMLDTAQLLSMPEGISQNEIDIRKGVLENRILMYGQMLHLPDNLAKKFLQDFAKEINGAIAGELAKDAGVSSAKHAQEAGKILATYLDSMSAGQKQKLASFANSLPASKVDKDFRQAIQLAMNNWSSDSKEVKASDSLDSCFSSDNSHMGSVKQGFIAAMGKEVKDNRDSFWATIDAASIGKEEDKPAARELLAKKWGKTLPAYMQSLRVISNSAPNELDRQAAKDSLARINAAMGAPKAKKEDETGSVSEYEIAMLDRNGKAAKVAVTEKRKAGGEGIVEEISLGGNDIRNFTLAEIQATQPVEASQPEAVAVEKPEGEIPAEKPVVGEVQEPEKEDPQQEIVTGNTALEAVEAVIQALEAEKANQKPADETSEIKIEVLPKIPSPETSPSTIAQVGLSDMSGIQQRLNDSIHKDMTQFLATKKQTSHIKHGSEVVTDAQGKLVLKRQIRPITIVPEQIPMPVLTPPPPRVMPELKPATIDIQRRQPEVIRRPAWDPMEESKAPKAVQKMAPLEMSGHVDEIPLPQNLRSPEFY